MFAWQVRDWHQHSRTTPSKNFSVISKPYWRLNGSTPTAEQTEYLPPTQSQNAKAFFGSMPNSLTSFRLVDTATMCFATAAGPSSAVNHVLHATDCTSKPCKYVSLVYHTESEYEGCWGVEQTSQRQQSMPWKCASRFTGLCAH